VSRRPDWYVTEIRWGEGTRDCTLVPESSEGVLNTLCKRSQGNGDQPRECDSVGSSKVTGQADQVTLKSGTDTDASSYLSWATKD
jgi:hypothetical protein